MKGGARAGLELHVLSTYLSTILTYRGLDSGVTDVQLAGWLGTQYSATFHGANDALSRGHCRAQPSLSHRRSNEVHSRYTR